MIRQTCTNIQKALLYKLQCEGVISFCFILFTGSFPNHSCTFLQHESVCLEHAEQPKTKSFSDEKRGESQDRNPPALFPNLLQMQIPEVKNWWSVMIFKHFIISVACQQNYNVGHILFCMLESFLK